MAQQFPLFQVDAFTRTPLAGNACAVVLDAESLDAATMQCIALEMNLSETSFVSRAAASDEADFQARYFTPAEEIPMAGHPTVATAVALVESGALRLDGGSTRFLLRLPAGLIPVEIVEIAPGLLSVSMVQLAPRFLATLDPGEVLPAFGLEADDLRPGSVVQVVSTGTPQLMLLLRDHAALRRARIVPAAYLALRERAGFFSPHLFCLRGATPDGDTFARHFGVPPDTPEDPFTGSATGGMAAYLWHHGLVAAPRFVAEQGHWMGRPGSGIVERIGSPGAIEGVRLSGEAVTVIRGHLQL